jgi:hypothetical protein
VRLPLKFSGEQLHAHRHFSALIFLFITALIITIGVNAVHFHYPGNAYFPNNIPCLFLLFCLMYSGSYLLWGDQSYATQVTRELIHLFLVMALVFIGCVGIQYTPFAPIDLYIIHWDHAMHIHLAALMHWTQSHPVLHQSMAAAYASLNLQLLYLPLTLIFLGQFKRLHEYYVLLLITAFIGYLVYYFFPTTAPASMIESPYFTEAQRATGLKFKQIHAHIPPSTASGGMIAFPSFHIIWAWLCTFLFRDWRVAFYLLLTLNITLTVACVLLGWHYASDIIASIFILATAHYTYFKLYPKNGDQAGS